MEGRQQKILVIRFSSIGDIVLCSPIFRCLKKQLGAEVHWLTKSKFASINNSNPNIDKTWTIDKHVSECIQDLKDEKFDSIIDLHKNYRSYQVKSSLKVKAFHFDKINVEKWLRVYTRLNFLPKKHLVDRYFEGLKSLGVKNDGLGLDYFYPSSIKLENGLVANEYITIVLGANYYTKRVPEHLVRHVILNYKKPIVLIGGSDVSELGKTLSVEEKHVLNLCGKTDIHASAAIVKNSLTTITGDTGMMHIAAALKKPIISVWGSTHHQLGMYPYYGNLEDKNISIAVENLKCRPCSKIGRDKCPLGHYKCLRLLDVNRLMDAIYRHTQKSDKTF